MNLCKYEKKAEKISYLDRKVQTGDFLSICLALQQITYNKTCNSTGKFEPVKPGWGLLFINCYFCSPFKSKSF